MLSSLSTCSLYLVIEQVEHFISSLTLSFLFTYMNCLCFFQLGEHTWFFYVFKTLIVTHCFLILLNILTKMSLYSWAKARFPKLPRESYAILNDHW